VRKKIRKIIFLLTLVFIFLGTIYYIFGKKAESETWSKNNQKTITIIDGGLKFYFANVTEKTVGDFLTARELALQTGDSVFPDTDTQIFTGTQIHIARARQITVRADGREQTFHVQAFSVGQALDESGIALNEDDIVQPPRDTLLENKIKITVTRVVIEEQTVEKPIVFNKKINEDNTLSWRKNIVTQKGEKGVERLTYRVSLHDNKEINRKLLKKEVVKEPITEITTQGTYVKLGKSHNGAASWYAWSGAMTAANPWLPLGSFVKVTNLGNGQSIIVKINDRGPFVPGRIIDLDKIAFQKIASIGAGVINVKMEEIVN
jgi:uncharacterized protein YabE (DUF348 family)